MEVLQMLLPTVSMKSFLLSIRRFAAEVSREILQKAAAFLTSNDAAWIAGSKFPFRVVCMRFKIINSKKRKATFALHKINLANMGD